MVCIFAHSEQKNSEYRHFSRSEYVMPFFHNMHEPFTCFSFHIAMPQEIYAGLHPIFLYPLKISKTSTFLMLLRKYRIQPVARHRLKGFCDIL